MFGASKNDIFVQLIIIYMGTEDKYYKKYEQLKRAINDFGGWLNEQCVACAVDESEEVVDMIYTVRDKLIEIIAKK